jgi:hypothetical protein
VFLLCIDRGAATGLQLLLLSKKTTMNRVTLFICAILLLLLQPAHTRILTRREPDQVQEEEEEDTPWVLGGYQHVDNVRENPMIQEAATFALQDLQEEQPYGFGAQPISGVKVIDAWQQVVQGINFQLTLMFSGAGEDENDDCVGACVVQIYNQFGVLSVTAWNKELSCEQAKMIMQESEGDEN